MSGNRATKLPMKRLIPIALAGMLYPGATPGCCGAKVVVRFVEVMLPEMSGYAVDNVPPGYFLSIAPAPGQRYSLHGSRYPLEKAAGKRRSPGYAPGGDGSPPPADRTAPSAESERQERERLAAKRRRIGALRQILSEWIDYDRSLDQKGSRDPADHASLLEWLEQFPLDGSRKGAQRIPDQRLDCFELALARYQRYVETKARTRHQERYGMMAETLMYDVRRYVRKVHGGGRTTVAGSGLTAEQARADAEGNARAAAEGARMRKEDLERIDAREARNLLLLDQILDLSRRGLRNGGLPAAEAILRELCAYVLADGKIMDVRSDFEEEALEILRDMGGDNVLPAVIDAMGTEDPRVREYLGRIATELARLEKRSLPSPKWKQAEWQAWYERDRGPWPLGDPPTLEGLDLSPVELLPMEKRK